MLIKVLGAGEGAFDVEVKVFELERDEVDVLVAYLKKFAPEARVESVDRKGYPFEAPT
jgi:hypothetical protein